MIDKYLNLARELKKKTTTVEHKEDGDTNYVWCTWNNPQRIGKGVGRLGNKTSRNHPGYRIIKISQNTEKSPGDFKGVAVT